MIIIRRKNNAIISIAYFIILLFYTSCKSQVAISSDKKCVLATSNKEMILDVGNNEILKNQLKEFYDRNNKYDIILYKSKSGEIDIIFKRIYNKDNKWFYIEVSNNKIITQKEMNINNSDFEILFKNFENVGMYKNCGMCFGCYNYFSLIKKDKKIFSYYYDSLSDNLSDADLAKLEPYRKILDFFSQYNLSFVK
ncbi:hypothetical protein [Chryseobacterium geocarposphaerae]|uniref:Uncharacterized protein n=1 Tax=Chryseobacterium geocarposphaerae TaxID=1416776 RepID=A0A2M9BXD5_9FLAO|nr:hypothetical protein [Chryseobacterium geocarposphaerae]PJJ62637.1 hypothetical protein CLV73_3822 [Chryseobacterium geocarposphaerae]